MEITENVQITHKFTVQMTSSSYQLDKQPWS